MGIGHGGGVALRNGVVKNCQPKLRGGEGPEAGVVLAMSAGGKYYAPSPVLVALVQGLSVRNCSGHSLFSTGLGNSPDSRKDFARLYMQNVQVDDASVSASEQHVACQNPLYGKVLVRDESYAEDSTTRLVVSAEKPGTCMDKPHSWDTLLADVATRYDKSCRCTLGTFGDTDVEQYFGVDGGFSAENRDARIGDGDDDGDKLLGLDQNVAIAVIAGGACCCLLIVALVLGLCCLIMRKRKRRTASAGNNGSILRHTSSRRLRNSHSRSGGLRNSRSRGRLNPLTMRDAGPLSPRR